MTPTTLAKWALAASDAMRHLTAHRALTFQIAGYQPLQRSLPRQIDVTYSMPNANALQIGVSGTPPGFCQRMQ
jgi:hypothetical protein